MINTTPLRYPGGKSIISPLIEDIIKTNNLHNVIYAEPYAGGAGAALNLLLKGIVESVMINDACIGIYSFWRYLLEKSNQFMTLFEETPVTLEEWQKQRTIFKNRCHPSLELGFATFFLSRCNRSGILYAGPIGGQDPESQKNAKYKIDCRFNKKTLRKQLKNIIRFKNKIMVSHEDALSFLKKISRDDLFIYIDPPYYEKGKQLYMNYYMDKDHKDLAMFLAHTKLKWILSYDNVKPIRILYKDLDIYEFSLTYSVQKPRIGSELFTHSPLLRMPNKLGIHKANRFIPFCLLEESIQNPKVTISQNVYQLTEH